MLVKMTDLLKQAERDNIAIGCFNCVDLESVIAVTRAAEICGKPVILGFPQVHEKTIPLRVIGPILLDTAERTDAPVCVHLDHGSSIDYILDALKMGFPSVMYDGSHLQLEDNIANTAKVVALAKEYGSAVEAELGGIEGDEAGVAGTTAQTGARLTDPEDAIRFAEETGIDSLAASIGTAHGFYTAAPRLDFDLIDKIHHKTGLPLVMHGGSGVSEEDYLKAISLGIRKINYFSYMSKAGTDSVKAVLKEKDVKYYHELTIAATMGMQQNVQKAIKLFSMKQASEKCTF